MNKKASALFGKLKRRDSIFILVGIVFCTIATSFWYTPPLLASSTRATYTIGALTHEAQVEHLLGFSARMYITLPEKVDGIYQYFVIDLRTMAVYWSPYSPATTHCFGLPAVSRFGTPGIDLELRTLDKKEWNVVFSGHEIKFTNGTLSISIEL